MTAEPILVLAWLALAHLAADFVLQTASIAGDKGGRGMRAVRGLGLHGFAVALCLVPVGLAYGGPGWALLALVTMSHVMIDRVKALATVRAHRAADPCRPPGESGPPGHLGPTWTPVPGALFILDQIAHAAILVAAWALVVADAPILAEFGDAVDRLFGDWDRALVHQATLAIVVIVALAIVNVRAAALFVATLVGAVPAAPAAAAPAPAAAAPAPAAAAPAPAAAAPAPAAAAAGPARNRPLRAWTLRLGPIVGRVEAEPDGEAASAAAPGPGPDAPGATSPPPPDRVGEAIGVLERLLIVTFVLTGVEAAIGLVIAAKTIARFRQLDDRDFAEYYLLGTLASVSVALVSAAVAAAALRAAG